MQANVNHVGWFMAYAFSIKDGDRLQVGSCTWMGAETPWQKIDRWNKDPHYSHRSFVLLSWQPLTEQGFFDCDSETDF